jgi:tRNA A37 methylthiotransferase MiaB
MKEARMAEKKKVGMVSLGCPKNLVDSEVMMGMLAGQGFEITNDSEAADVLVVNTCGFIDSARQESVNTILEMARLKQTPGRRGLPGRAIPRRFAARDTRDRRMHRRQRA